MFSTFLETREGGAGLNGVGSSWCDNLGSLVCRGPRKRLCPLLDLLPSCLLPPFSLITMAGLLSHRQIGPVPLRDF